MTTISKTMKAMVTIGPGDVTQIVSHNDWPHPVPSTNSVRIACGGLAEFFGIKLDHIDGVTKAARVRDVALAYDTDMFVMAPGTTVFTDTEALRFFATISSENCHAVWACQIMMDIANGRGPSNTHGHLHLSEGHELGVHPDKNVFGPSVAGYA